MEEIFEVGPIMRLNPSKEARPLPEELHQLTEHRAISEATIEEGSNTVAAMGSSIREDVLINEKAPVTAGIVFDACLQPSCLRKAMELNRSSGQLGVVS
jgi:hypothetical protein